MTIKQLSVWVLLSAIVISPLLVGAEVNGKTSDKKTVQEKLKEVKNDLKDIRTGTTSTRPTSSDQSASSSREKDRFEGAKTRTIQAATNIAKKITREIAKVRNIIDRLTNSNSIIAKLEANGINTTAIKAKLDSAKILLTKAETDVQSARDIIAGTATSTDPSIKTKVVGVRKLFDQANSNLKLALAKVKEANKLIREIPGVRKIEKGDNATSTATTTP